LGKINTSADSGNAFWATCRASNRAFSKVTKGGIDLTFSGMVGGDHANWRHQAERNTLVELLNRGNLERQQGLQNLLCFWKGKSQFFILPRQCLLLNQYSSHLFHKKKVLIHSFSTDIILGGDKPLKDL
jgi:hypothetical protein